MSDEEFPEGKVLQREYGGRGTTLAVPLVRDERALGVITLVRGEVRPFTDRQVALLQTFADQAVIAIENVRLFTELQSTNRELTTALDKQTATGEVLRVIAGSLTDVQPVFATIMENALRLCSAQTAAVLTFDGHLIHAGGFLNIPADAEEQMRRLFPRVPDQSSAAGRAILSGDVAEIPDVEADPDYTFASAVRAGGLRSNTAVPMLRDARVVGTINLGRSVAGRFSESEIALLKTFADQAVIAIENVRLFTELQTSNRELTTALEQQTATSEILRVISQSQTDVRPVFETILTSAVRLLRGYSGALTRVAGDQIELAAHTRTDDTGDASLRELFPQSLHSEIPHAQAIRTRAPIDIADTQTDPRMPDALRTSARVRGYRSWITVPLLRHQETIGTIAVTRPEAGGFDGDEIALLQTFAAQAVIAIENVRLVTELQTSNRELMMALDQQTATSEILRVISQSPTDLKPVFDAIVDSAARLCQAAFGVLHRFDGQDLTFEAQHGIREAQLERVRHYFPQPARRDMAVGRAVLDRSVTHIHDIRVDPEYVIRSFQEDYRTVLAVPLMREGVPVGALGLWRRKVQPFSDQQIELVKTFADQAVIAIENVRLFKELEARTQDLTRSVGELTALGEVSRALSSTLDLETVLQAIVLRANELAGTAGCTIWEYDQAGEEFRLRASNYPDEADAVALQGVDRVTIIRKGVGVTTQVMERRQPVQVDDIAVEGAEENPIRRRLIDAGHHALLGVPLLSEDEVIGVLAVTRKTSGEFEPEIVRLLSTFATQSALAIRNARLFLEIENKSRQLEAASQHKSEFLANMSHELRTPLNAIIGFSEVLVDGMFGEVNEKQVEYLNDILESGRHLLSLINDILDLSKIEAGRMELDVDTFDLRQALDNGLTLVRERASRRGVRLDQALDPRVSTVQADERKVKQVLLNLLSNALKFTPEGGHVTVRARLIEKMVEISVSDTGVGIALEDQEAVFEEFRQVGTASKKVEGTGLGLALCRKFVEFHGGKIWVESQLGAGSTFTFTIPVQPPRA